MNRRKAIQKTGAFVGGEFIPAEIVADATAESRSKSAGATRAELRNTNGIGVLRFPSGATIVGVTSIPKDEIAKTIAEHVTPGCILCLPSERDEHGNLLWDLIILESAEPVRACECNCVFATSQGAQDARRGGYHHPGCPLGGSEATGWEISR